jgi:hypothetical protein
MQLRQTHASGIWARMGVTQVIPLYHPAYHVQLPRRNGAVECKAFGRFAPGACPKIPHIFGRSRVPKRLTAFALTSLNPLTNFASPISAAAAPFPCRQLTGEV